MKSDTYRSNVIDHLLGNVSFTPPATLYAALYTVAPTESGGGVEVSGGSYARVSVTNNLTNFPAATLGTKSNGTSIVFPTATASWGQVTSFGLHSHATNDALVVWGMLDDELVVTNGTTPTFPPASLSFSEE